MSIISRKQFILSALAGVAGAFAAQYLLEYKIERKQAIARLLAAGEQVKTDKGWMEYAQLGAGPIVMVSHGSLGGFDQGLAFKPLISGYTLLSPSRPGYLRTPLELGRTPAEQADAFAALLDKLDIPKISIIAVSAGAPAALEFAKRYPERCWGLVLISAGVLPPPRYAALSRLFGWNFLSSDFLSWLIVRLFPDRLILASGTRREDLRELKKRPFYYRTVLDILNTPLAGWRLIGQKNDIHQAAGLPVPDLSTITTPCLVIHGLRDQFTPFTGALYLVDQLPNVELVAIDEGGHLAFATHFDIFIGKLLSFLKKHCPADA